MNNIYILILAYLLSINLIAYFAYKNDKKKALMGDIRTSEYTLLMLHFLGGTVGAIYSMIKNRHKTKKFLFIAKFIVLWIVQMVTAYAVCMFSNKL